VPWSETARWAPGLAYQEIHMKRSVVEVDRLLQELLPPLQLTDEAVVAAVVDVLGQIAGGIAEVIEGSESAEQAFSWLAERDVARQLYQAAGVFGSTRRMLELRAAAARVR
jgi:hypothetical protein